MSDEYTDGDKAQMMAFIEKLQKYTAKRKILKVLKLFKMIKIDLIKRIELIEAQIENDTTFWHFTEKEIDTNIYPLEMEPESLRHNLMFWDLCQY
jgi:hypothetical protein